MTENKIFFLAPPDLGDLMSTILGKSSEDDDNKNRRLVFTEYRPATRGFYNHIGIPKQDKEDIIKWLNEQIDNGKNNYSYILNVIIEKFESAHKTATGSDFDAHSLKSDILDLWKKMLVSLKEKYAEGTDTYNILSKLCFDPEDEIEIEQTKSLYNALRIFSENMPAPSNTGRVGEKKVHEWNVVPSEVDEFERVAVFEYFFGMRASKINDIWQLNSHARINVFLDTGEYVGQIIAFAPLDSNSDIQTKLFEKAKVAACLVRSVLPGIRQARYMNAILRGGPGNIDHIMVHHLPYLLPVSEFFVRIYDDGEQISWSGFFAKSVWFYSSKAKEDDAENGKTNSYYNAIFSDEKNFFLEPYNMTRKTREVIT